jgi:hypothetical protein
MARRRITLLIDRIDRDHQKDMPCACLFFLRSLSAVQEFVQHATREIGGLENALQAGAAR